MTVVPPESDASAPDPDDADRRAPGAALPRRTSAASVDNTMDEDPFAADRPWPEVSSQTSRPKWPIIAFLGAMATLGIFVVSRAATNNQPAPVTAQRAEDFQPASAMAPKVPEKTSPLALADGTAPDRQDAAGQPSTSQLVLTNEERTAIQTRQDDAARRREEARQQTETRRKSTAVAFDQSSGVGEIDRSGGDSPVAEQSAKAAQTEEDDPNKRFLARASLQEDAATQAGQLANPTQTIAQGTMISGVLETAIQSDLPGMVRAVVSNDVYSFDGGQLLVPKGARLIGEYKSGLVTGQTRVFVIWTRLLRPDAVSVRLASPGTDIIGRAGLGGRVDNHFVARFGASAVLSLLTGGVAALGNNDRVVVDTGKDFKDAASVALENQIRIPPTIHVNQGAPINIFVARDLDFSGAVAVIRRPTAATSIEGRF
jgi:type IV secretion system protein VirB10